VQGRTLSTLLAVSFVFAGIAQAQRVSGGAARGGSFSGFSGHSGFRSGFRTTRSRFQNFRNDALFWDDGAFEYAEPDESGAPPLTIAQSGWSRSAKQEIPAASPKVIEVPGSSAPSKPLPPATFILKNGERLETRRYLLTYDNLYVTVDRQQRTIPLSMVDMTATITADRERGIDLRVPADRREISLSF
jgi:hypothetical protein